LVEEVVDEGFAEEAAQVFEGSYTVHDRKIMKS
jgi:hypothetical protein